MKKLLITAAALLPLALTSCKLEMPDPNVYLDVTDTLTTTATDAQSAPLSLPVGGAWTTPSGFEAQTTVRSPLTVSLTKGGLPDPSVEASGTVHVARPGCVAPQRLEAASICLRELTPSLGKFWIKAGYGGFEAEGTEIAEALKAGELELQLKVTEGSVPEGHFIRIAPAVRPN